jgi:hypothetical protein
MTFAGAGSAPSRTLLALGLLFLLALMPRLYSAQTLGWNWDAPNSFTLINFDEGGSCRAALRGFPYSTFVGHQTIALASALGLPPPAGVESDRGAVKAYCHSPGHILVARSYSAILGALTVVAVALLALQLVPARPRVAWTAGALLALSGFHISHSQSGTVDAPSVFFITSFLAALAWYLRRRSNTGLLVCVLLGVAAVWTKYWVFAVLAWLALLPASYWRYVSSGFSRTRLVALVLTAAVCLAALTNTAFPRWGLFSLLAAYCLLVPWRAVHRPMALAWLVLPLAAYAVVQIDLVNAYTQGALDSRFGSGYGAIGPNKWLRNLVNVPAVLLVGLGIPACLFIPRGLRALLRDRHNHRYWVCLLPVLAFLVFMALLAPVTYYRHYLPLLPVAAILAALGLHETRVSARPWFMALFFAWPALLAWDLVSDYHRDPRIELRQWFADKPQARVWASFYVSPPAGRASLFRPEYADGNDSSLRRADYLVLSENWYDTAFANELNGPRVKQLDRLVKTTPDYARFHRRVLAGEHPYLRPELALNLQHFMPELMLHRRFYGNFQLFVGDLRIYRVE